MHLISMHMPKLPAIISQYQHLPDEQKCTKKRAVTETEVNEEMRKIQICLTRNDCNSAVFEEIDFTVTQMMLLLL